MSNYLRDDELLITGRAGVNLPQFPSRKEYRERGDTIFDALTSWTRRLLRANEVKGGDNKYHPHHVPEQLILPATADSPLLVVRSIDKGLQVSKGYRPNNNYQDTGYLVPTRDMSTEQVTSIAVAPAAVASEFTELFASKRSARGGPYHSSDTTTTIGEECCTESYSSSWGTTASKCTPERERKIRPLVEAILDQFGYDESAFSGSDVITGEEYGRLVCERFDPVERSA